MTQTIKIDGTEVPIYRGEPFIIDQSRFKWKKQKSISYDSDLGKALTTAFIANYDSAYHDLKNKDLDHISEVITEIEDIKIKNIAVKSITTTVTFIVSEKKDD